MEQSFGDIVISIFNIAIIGGIALTIFMIVFQGINVLNSRGDPSAFSRAKEKIKSTLIGLGVLLLSYVLLYTINPNILNSELNIGEIEITPFTPTPAPELVKELDVYTFEEIPLGTITEELLAGVSSVDVPCYQYETRLKDAHGNIIVGNVVDQNGDGEIDEKDILLNKDLFYCIKLLTDAYNAKIGEHLATLVEELNDLMKNNCACTSCYTGRMVGAEYDNNYGHYTKTYGCSVGRDPDATYDCLLPYSYCRTCCGTTAGCPDASAIKAYDEKEEDDDNRNPFVESLYYDDDDNEYSFKQYKYDPCDKRLEITCKSQEIEQLVTGKKPDKICYLAEYDNGKKYIDPSAPLAEQGILLTINEAVGRIDEFKKYYEKRLKDLKQAKSTMKTLDKKISLAEFTKLQSEVTSYKITKAPFSSDYDISRYCKEYNKMQKVNNKIEDPKDNHPCKLLDGERNYFYDGDEATFYTSSYYDKLIPKVTEEKKCTTMEVAGDESLGIYRGEIPIGETVDMAIEWGEEAVRSITEVHYNAKEIENEAKKIYTISDNCECKNCKSGNYGWYWYGKATSCSKNYCSCNIDYTLLPCNDCVPRASYSGKIIMVGGSWYAGCGDYYKREKALDPAPTHWVCPYEKFCDIVKNIYWNKSGGFDNDYNCFKRVKDPQDAFSQTEKEKILEEVKKRENKVNNIGYLQRFDGYSGVFLQLARLNDDDIKKGAIYDSDVYKSVCPKELRKTFSDEEDSPSVVVGSFCPYNYTPVEGDGYDGSLVDCSGGIYGHIPSMSDWNCPAVGSWEWTCKGYFKELEDMKTQLTSLKEEYKDKVGDGPGEVPADALNYLSAMINKIDKYHEGPVMLYDDWDGSYPADPLWGTREGIDNLKMEIEEAIDMFNNMVAVDTNDLLNSLKDKLEDLVSDAEDLKEETGIVGIDEDNEDYSQLASPAAHGSFNWSTNQANNKLYYCNISTYPLVTRIQYCQEGISIMEEAIITFESQIVVKEDPVSLFQKAMGYISKMFNFKKEEKAEEKIKYPTYYSLAAIFDDRSCKEEYNLKAVTSRFDILEKLEESREKLGRCVKGYSAAYKDNPTEIVEIFSCTEGVNGVDGLLVLPTFPWPDKSKETWPYYNCYPYNSSELTKEEKRDCFYNPLREGTESNPGCLRFIEDYMDNYYCCN